LFKQGNPDSNSPVAMANMIVTTTRITVSSANRSELFQTILTLLAPVRTAKGCRSSSFYLDSADNNTALLIEEWETQEDWDNHLQSRDCAVFLGAVSVLCKPASVDFKLLSYVAGIEAITAARNGHVIEY
jgi:quinol monooxygenase YgiN